MNFDDVKTKYKKGNKLLFSRESECLQELLSLIRAQKHRTLVIWAFECLKAPLGILKNKYPNDNSPGNAIKLCKEWAWGSVKMPIAKKAILKMHAMAKELGDPVDIALCHAVGHGCATVHVETHAIGLPIYELTAIVHKYGIENCDKMLEEKINFYMNTLHKNIRTEESNQYEWAGFLLDDTKPNKEKLIYEKQK